MPHGANRNSYAKFRTLAIALERRGANDRQRIIAALAGCIAECRRLPHDWIAALDADELAAAMRLSATLAFRRRWRIGTAMAASSRLWAGFIRLLTRVRRGSNRRQSGSQSGRRSARP
jgi:hypothetical protein